MKSFLAFALLSTAMNAQNNNRFKEGLKIYLNNDSTHYVKATGLAQIWVRFNENNPGSTVSGTKQSQTFDVGLRRARYQAYGQLTDRVFLYTQIGINSFNYLTTRKTPIFFHDVTAEYIVFKKHLNIGAGLHGWNGTARYSSSGVGNILGLDLPTIQETTNDVTDQFVRKLGVYAHGELGRLNYRASLSNPFILTAANGVATLGAADTNIAYFSTQAPKMQGNGYLFYQFLDKETTLLPYMAGSYLGKKRIVNVGSGFTYQPDAMWYRKTNGDTAKVPLQQFGADVFIDYYLNKEKQNAVTFYASYLDYNFGPKYIRNAGPMNPANGTTGTASFNGAGNAYPLIGTGNVIYAQGAYLFKKDLLKSYGTLQPYFNFTYAQYQRLKDPLLVYSVGFNWLIAGNASKISLEYQDRPIYTTRTNGNIEQSTRRGGVILQYQASF
ncbi:MAG: hypothetical protein ACJ76F_09620 [Bacteroidia bacterium]